MNDRKDIPKQYDSHSAEKKWYPFWEENGYFHAEVSHQGKPYSIVIPPPNVTGALHLGHALNHTIQDILVRWKRMQGANVLWVPGTDHAGIATQAVVEKRIYAEEKKTRHDIGRETLLKRIWDWKNEYETRILGQLRMMGSSCDWTRTRFTLDEVCSNAVRETFFHFFKKGLIFRGKRLVNWDTHLQTAVADDEIVYENIKSHLWYFKYPITQSEKFLVIATTRPETMLGDTAVAVHPDDERYKEFIGQSIKLPFVNREIPIIGDAQLVDPEFGTGCVKVTPAHDPNDYATGLRHNLEMINIFTLDGHINENGGPFHGMDRDKARKLVVQQLEKMGLVEKIEDYETQVGHSDRSKTPIEPLLSDQWFIKMDGLAEEVMSSVKNEKVKFHPVRYAKACIDWLSEKRDWCISRQLWWGHRIPIWYCEGVSENDLEKAFKDRDDVAWTKEKESWLICSLKDLDPNLVDLPLVQDKDVLDTWFSSALWPLSTLGWPDDETDLNCYYPTSVLVTSRDIISLWVARMILMGLENVGQIPFHEVYIHTKILDGQGRTMSKSLGNGVDPLDIIEKYGADALRYTMAALCTDNQDARLPVKLEKLSDGRQINTSERFELGRNFSNKIWNASRFLIMALGDTDKFNEPGRADLSLDDRALLARLNEMIQKTTHALNQYHFNDFAQILYDFFWHHFCDHYLEAIKPSLYGDDKVAKNRIAWITLRVLKDFLKLLHPVMPFISEELWQRLMHFELGDSDQMSSIMLAKWPEPYKDWLDEEAIKQIDQKYDLIRIGRNLRAQHKIQPSQSVPFIIRPSSEKNQKFIEQEQKDIERFMRASELNLDIRFKTDVPMPSDVSLLGTVYMDIRDSFDPLKETQRLEKKLANHNQELNNVQAKLSNRSFVEKAPAAVIEKVRGKEKSILEEIEKVKENLNLLKN